MRWHHENASNDGQMRHPVDSPAWKTIDDKWPSFSSEPRNVRLAMAVDGFNPFGDLSSTYSVWPVVLVTYNLPPWLCTKRNFCMLTLLIPGPKQPGNDIDVYLEPLVDELKELWDQGVWTYDAYSKTSFNMKAILMWVIHDFPAYGNMAGCTTKGYNACPICGRNTESEYLSCSRKCVYMGHRRFLPQRHKFRSQKAPFNGKEEHRYAPPIVKVSDIFKETKGKEAIWGKIESNKRKRNSKTGEKTDVVVWKKQSILFNLPYWEVCRPMINHA